jgi:putative polyhydroxyalkanoate system protein
MSQPIEVDLPHNLGKEEARRRIADNMHRLQEHLPGGANVESGWAGDQLNLRVHALGDTVQSTIDVEETKVRVKMLLPGLLGMFSGVIQSAIAHKGGTLLEDHSKG